MEHFAPHSKCLGLTISQTKGGFRIVQYLFRKLTLWLGLFIDFLALESLLDLFGSIVPLMKGGREKRSHYIKEVFDSSIFKCSDLVIEHLEHMSNPDWSITSMKIIKTLADSDLSL
jgi:hypothetical protein